MKLRPALVCLLLLAAAAVVPAVADEAKAHAEGSEEAKVRTIEGKIVCAKCALHEEGRTECQNVLVVENEGKTKQFYLTKNAVYDKFGEVCTGSPMVQITGEVMKKDGHTWLTASEIKKLDDKG